MSDDVYSGHHWRFLYHDVQEHEGAGLTEVLLRWLDEHPAHVEEVRDAGRPGHHLVPLDEPQVDSHYSPLQRLYALSRILDLLIMGYQDPVTDPMPMVRAVPPRDAYPAVCAALGADRITEPAFHPFFHEIVEVRQADDPDEPPSIVAERWPGHLIGSMLLMRAGVVVRSGVNHLVAGVADRSALYWTYQRRYRPVDDLSHGWGHNSQWRTDFRRDYLVDGRFHYNVDAALTSWDHEEKLDAASMIELVRHRCSTVVDLGADLFPYDDHHVEQAP